MRASPLQLERHFFTKVHVDAHPAGDPEVKAELRAEVDVARAQSDPKRYELTLRLKLQSPPEKVASYTAEIHVVGLVRVVDGWPKPQELVDANGPALLYGAAREMLCNLTARGPWPMLCLHSVTFVQPPKAPAATPAAPQAAEAKA